MSIFCPCISFADSVIQKTIGLILSSRGFTSRSALSPNLTLPFSFSSRYLPTNCEDFWIILTAGK